MLHVETIGAGPSMFAGAHHQSFENGDFRIAGRDMYNTPTVNVNITTPASRIATNRARMDLARAPVLQTTPYSVQAQGGRGLWSRGFARLMRGRTVRENPVLGQGEELRNTAMASPLTSGNPVAAEHGRRRSATNDSMGSDFAISPVESFDNLSLNPENLSNAEVYVRSLSSSKGLACWQPTPPPRFSDVEGVVPGDVGTFSAEDGFWKTFNLWEDVSSIRASGKTESERHFQPPDRDIAWHGDKMHGGETVVEGAVSSTIVSAMGGQRRTSTFEFRCHSPRGAVLALTSPADSFEAVHQIELRDCIARNAQLLYRHAESIRRIGHDESLYFVTGCVKTDSWGLAAFKEPMSAPEDLLQLVHIGWDNALDQPNAIYAWTKRGTSEARCGENLQAMRVKDQCIFLKGFKLAFSQDFRIRIRKEFLQDSSGHPDFEPSGGNARDMDGGSSRGYGGSRAMGIGAGGTSGSFHGRGAGGSGQLAEGISIEQFPENRSQLYHPCDLINAFLLETTGADVALSHDDDWRFHLQESSSTWGGFIHEILDDILKSQSIFVSGGVAFVDKESPARARSEGALHSIFLGWDSPPVLRYPSAWFDVEVLRFAIPVHWCPAPLPTDLLLRPTLGPLRREEEESLSVALQRFLAFDLAIRHVRNVNGSTMISFDKDHVVSGLHRSAGISGINSGSPTFFGCPPDPTLVVLSAIWHRMRTWDTVIEHLSIRLGFIHRATMNEAGRAPISQHSLVWAFNTTYELYDEITELFEMFVEDLPFSQDECDHASERIIFLNTESGSLRTEASRLKSILSRQGRLLETLHDRATCIAPPRTNGVPDSATDTEQSATLTGSSRVHAPDGERQLWYREPLVVYDGTSPAEGPHREPAPALPLCVVCKTRPADKSSTRHCLSMTCGLSCASKLQKEREARTSPFGATSQIHPIIEKIAQKASRKLGSRTGRGYTLDVVLRLATFSRKRGLRQAECGALGTALGLLIQAHIVMSRWIPEHPDYFLRLTEKERQNLSLYAEFVSWDIQELCPKVIRGGDSLAKFASEESRRENNVVGSVDALYHAVSEADVRVLLSRPPGKIPLGYRPLDIPEKQVPEFEDSSGQEARSNEPSDPWLHLEQAAKRMFGPIAQIDYKLELTGSSVRAVDSEESKRSVTAYVRGPDVFELGRKVATGSGATIKLATEDAAVCAYDALRDLNSQVDIS